ncbi:MAG: peroxiredoxin Q/BCP [Gammaproteobacteria bacterium]
MSGFTIELIKPGENIMLEPGQQAPEFTSINQDEKPVSLSDFKGRNLVLYFYPRDDTPGCTTEGIDFSGLTGEFEQANTIVIGVSKDSAIKHQKFIKKRDLKIDLLADIEGEICEAYGTWGEKQFMGKHFMGIVRSTFIIDISGKLAEVQYKVRVKGHAQAILERVREINQNARYSSGHTIQYLT